MKIKSIDSTEIFKELDSLYKELDNLDKNSVAYTSIIEEIYRLNDIIGKLADSYIKNNMKD